MQAPTMRRWRYTDDNLTVLAMTRDQPANIAQILSELRTEHRDLDLAIARLTTAGHPADPLSLIRMKKRKLKLKDMMTYLENQLIPDLDA